MTADAQSADLCILYIQFPSFYTCCASSLADTAPPLRAPWQHAGKGHCTQFIFRSPRGEERPAQLIPPEEEEIAGDFPQQSARQATVKAKGAVLLDDALHYWPNCTEGEIDPVSDVQWCDNKVMEKKWLRVRWEYRGQDPHKTQN